jgi:chemotaxis protein MotB
MEEGKVMQFVKSFVTAVSILPSGVKFESDLAVVPDSAELVDSISELAKIFQTFDELASEFSLENEINLAITREGLVMRMSEQTLFGLGSADIAAEALPLLQKVGAIISKTAYLIRIEGHTDIRYFIKNHNIDPQRLAAEGFSEFHPLVANDTVENREKNRRVEIVFIKKEQSKAPIGEIL